MGIRSNFFSETAMMQRHRAQHPRVRCRTTRMRPSGTEGGSGRTVLCSHRDSAAAGRAPPGTEDAQGRAVLTPPGPALTVLVRGEGPGVDVDVRVDLDGGDAQPAGFQDGADAAGDDPFADARDHPARHQDVLHLPAGLTARLRRGRAAPAPPRRPALPPPRPADPPALPGGAHLFPRAGSCGEERTRTPCRRGAQAHEAGGRQDACAVLLGRVRSAEEAGLRRRERSRPAGLPQGCESWDRGIVES